MFWNDINAKIREFLSLANYLPDLCEKFSIYFPITLVVLLLFEAFLLFPHFFSIVIFLRRIGHSIPCVAAHTLTRICAQSSI